MKYIKTFDKKEYNVCLWCYNVCERKEEILTTVDSSPDMLMKFLKDCKKDIKDYEKRSFCRKNFKITVDGEEVTNIKDWEVIVDAEKYNI